MTETRLRAAAERLADAAEDYLFTEGDEGAQRQALREAWQHYVDEAAEIDGQSRPERDDPIGTFTDRMLEP